MGSLLKTRGTVAVWAATAIIVVGCSSAPEVNTDPIPATTAAPTTTTEPAATTSTAAPTTATPPATTAAPTTTEPDTTEPDTTEADIREAVDMFFGIVSFNYNTGLPRDPGRDVFERWLTGAQLARALDLIETEVALGRYWEGELTYRVISISTAGDTAEVTACLRDTSVGFESNGTIFDDQEIFSTASLAIERVNGQWKTANFGFLDTQCAI